MDFRLRPFLDGQPSFRIPAVQRKVLILPLYLITILKRHINDAGA
jgi:hypothetical protein